MRTILLLTAIGCAFATTAPAAEKPNREETIKYINGLLARAENAVFDHAGAKDGSGRRPPRRIKHYSLTYNDSTRTYSSFLVLDDEINRDIYRVVEITGWRCAAIKEIQTAPPPKPIEQVAPNDTNFRDVLEKVPKKAEDEEDEANADDRDPESYIDDPQSKELEWLELAFENDTHVSVSKTKKDSSESRFVVERFRVFCAISPKNGANHGEDVERLKNAFLRLKEIDAEEKDPFLN